MDTLSEPDGGFVYTRVAFENSFAKHKKGILIHILGHQWWGELLMGDLPVASHQPQIIVVFLSAFGLDRW